MTVKVNNGSIVEDTFHTASEASEATEAYVWSRIMKDFAYSFNDSIETSDDDLNSYIGFLKNLEVEGNALGAIQAKATDFTTDEYLEDSGLGTAIPTVDANELEQDIGERVASSLSESNQELIDESNLQVPLTPDGEAMPLFVASEERTDGGLHTLEEAKEMWSDFLGHLRVEQTSEPTSDDEPNDEPSNESDENQHWLRDVNGVGSEVFGRIKERAVNEQQTLHYGDLLTESDVSEIRQADVIVTSDEATERLQAVAAEMPTGAFSIANEKISDGEISEAITLISDYE